MMLRDQRTGVQQESPLCRQREAGGRVHAHDSLAAGEPMDSGAETGYAPSWTTESKNEEQTVTEAEWQVCTNPMAMLGFLSTSGNLSERKFRLFAVACCRRIWHLLTDERSRRAVEVSERYADGMATSAELAEAREAARSLVHQMGVLNVFAASAAHESSSPLLLSELPIGDKTLMQHIAHAVVVAVKRQYHIKEARVVGWSRQEAILSCIFGPLPFRVLTLSSAVLAWNDSTVVRLAQAVYQECHLPTGTLDTGRLAVLADALEEAGCTDAEILDHLRGPGPHVRGCWPVDLCLGKV
jgi:hypothetical protein